MTAKIALPARAAYPRVLFVLFLLSVVSFVTPASACDTLGIQMTAYQPKGDATFEWTAPSGATGPVQYDVHQTTGPDFCTFTEDKVVAQTTSQTYTGTFSDPNLVYGIYVSSQSPCGGSAVWQLDTFNAPPPKPTAPSLVMNADHVVTATVSYTDPHALQVFLDRADGDGEFAQIKKTYTCPQYAKDPKVFSDGPLSEGRHRYRVRTSNYEGVVYSNEAEVTVASAAQVIVAAPPEPLVEIAGSSGATTTYVVKNVGGTDTTVTLSQTGAFFSQSPSPFALPAGAAQVVTITANAEPAGAYDGASKLSGVGVAADLVVPVRLLVAAAPAGRPVAVAPQNRVDVRSTSGVNVTGSVSFTNTGNDTVVGILTSDAPWIIPQSGVISIPPGQSVSVSFQIDDSKRPDVAGSITGTLVLTYLADAGTTAARLRVASASRTVTTPISIVSTRPPQVNDISIPALQSGEVALFLPGVGHVNGSVGLFLTDVTIANLRSAGTLNDVKLYYTSPSVSRAQVATLDALTAGQPLSLGDTTKSVFSTEGEVGTLQVRSANIEDIAASAVVFNASNPKGTYGSSIPVFRSDRSLPPGQQMFITGIRQRGSTHSNYYVQETAGAQARVTTDFFSADGRPLGSRLDTVEPFALRQLGAVFPEGTTSVVITNLTDSSGSIVAYVTPVDGGSGDTWAITDWSRQGAYSPSGAVVIPNVGAVHGANDTYFRSDVAVFNTSASSSAATATYYPRGGSPITRQVTLGPRETLVADDVAPSFFGLTNDNSGYIVLTPTSGSFSVASRTYTTPSGQSATLGTAVPPLALSQSARNGTVRHIAGLEDAALNTITSARPATFRTNFALIETSGANASVRVTVNFSTSSGGRAVLHITAAKVYELGPLQFLPVSGLVRDIIGERRDRDFGDLHNVQADFEVVSPAGAVLIYATSVDNGTGDSIMRVQ